MICFPNAKINLGLNITEKRSDGFHNIETIFYPIGWNDALEIIEAKNSTKAFNLHLSGLSISGNTEDNLLYKAYQIIKQTKQLPSIDVYLYKALPMGAGLGGGSADAAFFINLLKKAASALPPPKPAPIGNALYKYTSIDGSCFVCLII